MKRSAFAILSLFIAFPAEAQQRLVFVSNEGGRSLSIIDASFNKVVATLPLGQRARGIIASPDGKRIYVALSDDVPMIESAGDRIAVIDVPTRRVPNGARAYVTAEIGGSVSVIDVAKREVIETIQLKGGQGKPVGVVVSPDNKTVFVANGRASRVSVIDVATSKVVESIPVGRRPWGIALSRDGKLLYTANGLSDDVSVIDVASRKVIATVAVGKRPWGLTIVER